MLECRACVLRCIRAIAADSATFTSRPTPLALTPHLSIGASRRRLVTTVATIGRDASTSHETVIDNAKSSNNNSLASRQSEKQLRTELAYLKDPVKFADHVHYTLRQQKPEKALDLCRLASKSMSCIVAWNHIIDWMMKSKRVNEAIKIYNEMKKRGQFPDSYTYMLLLRGFSETGGEGQAEILEQQVVKAVSIYTSMASPTSRVKPSIMHTNAALRACSLARDMDALWSVASKIPEHGSGSADHKTYSILLGAIRFGAFGKGGNEHDANVPIERVAEIRQQAVNEGRRIWQEVIEKWRAGEVTIDESLVVQMACLLLFSKRMEDWDDVFNLIRQTTNIERLIEPLGSATRGTGHVPLDGYVDAQTTVTEDEDGWVPTPAANAFKAVSPHQRDPERPRRPTSLAYVRPGNGILNVIMLACANMRIISTAFAYWDKLTKEYHVVPDRDNFKDMLRLLQFNRSSRKAVELVQQMHSQHGVTPFWTTYKMAMAVLARDWKNKNVLDSAIILLNDMETHLGYSHPDVLQAILSLTRKTESSAHALRLLERMHELVPRLLSKPEAAEEAVVVLKDMVSTIDTTSFLAGLSPEEAQKLNSLRSTLNSHIGQAVNHTPGPRQFHVRARPDGRNDARHATGNQGGKHFNQRDQARGYARLDERRDAHRATGTWDKKNFSQRHQARGSAKPVSKPSDEEGTSSELPHNIKMHFASKFSPEKKYARTTARLLGKSEGVKSSTDTARPTVMANE